MNNEEAKFILGAYRPNGADAATEVFAGPIAQAGRDPALAAWFAREQAYDAAVAAKVAAIAPPAGLREAILTGGRVSGRPRGWWRQPAWLAVAAAFAVVLTVGSLWINRSRAVLHLTNFALADAADEARHGGHGAAEKSLRTLLGERGTKLDRPLPIDFRALAQTGCRTLAFSGETVLEVCFKRDGTWLHCYIVRCEDLPQMPKKQAPEFASSGKLNAVTWADGSYRFVVAGPVVREKLEELL